MCAGMAEGGIAHLLAQAQPLIDRAHESHERPLRINRVNRPNPQRTQNTHAWWNPRKTVQTIYVRPAEGDRLTPPGAIGVLCGLTHATNDASTDRPLQSDDTKSKTVNGSMGARASAALLSRTTAASGSLAAVSDHPLQSLLPTCAQPGQSPGQAGQCQGRRSTSGSPRRNGLPLKISSRFSYSFHPAFPVNLRRLEGYWPPSEAVWRLPQLSMIFPCGHVAMIACC